MNLRIPALAAAAACLLTIFSGCAKTTELPLPPQQAAEYRSDAGELLATCTLIALEMEPGDKDKQDSVTATLLFENTGDVALMRIACDCDFMAADDSVVEDAACTGDYHKNPMQPGETREYHVSRWIYDGEQVADIALAITEVVTIEEQPPLPEPKPGETLFDFYQRDDIAAFAADFYDNPPEKAVVFMDSWNLVDVELTDPADVAAVFEAMKQLRVGEPAEEYVTDSYNSVAFVLADGSEFHFSFNRYNLEYDGVIYAVSEDEALWGLLRELLDK